MAKKVARWKFLALPSAYRKVNNELIENNEKIAGLEEVV